MSNLMLDVDQAGELKAGFRRGNWTNEDIKKASEGDFLSRVLGVLRGTHEIKPVDHVIDLSVPCELPFTGAERISPAKSGLVKLERRGDDLFANDQKINLFLSEQQKTGVQGGRDLRRVVEARGGNQSAKILDHLKAHPELWPESWKKDDKENIIYVFFWDDIFRGSGGSLCVRYGCWRDGGVVSSCHWLGGDWDSNGPSASVK